jgi:hypothetical protein
VAEVTLTSTAVDFLVDESLEARLNDEVVFSRRWRNQVPRNGN